MAIELLCRKLGMTRIYTDEGFSLPVTVLEAGPNTVVQKKTPEREGYSALQLGYGEQRRKTLTKPALGHFDKAGVAPRRHLKESRVAAEQLEAHEVGSELGASLFEAGQRVDAIGVSKGRGTAGVVRRHNFAVKRKTHGTHEGHRRPGSIGAGAYPGHVWKGHPMYGRMGNERVTVKNLEVVRVDPEKNLLLVRGAVPGHQGGVVRVRAATSPKS